jgi:hypothetical protein
VRWRVLDCSRKVFAEARNWASSEFGCACRY